MTTLFATIVVLGVLIFVHELGHFMAAKMVDIRVERFSIGLGPRIWGTTRGETEYVISAIPLGGYVKMGGMEDEVMDKIEGGGAPEEPRVPGPRDFDAKTVPQRAFVISAGVIMNFLFAFLAYTVVSAFWGSPELETRRIGPVQADRLPAGARALAELPSGAEVVQVGDREILYWGDLQDAFAEEPAGPTEVRTEDPSASVTITLSDDPAERRALQGSLGVWLPAVVESVSRGTPAGKAGLRGGDRIISIDGVPIGSWTDLVEQIRPNPGVPLEFEIMRSGEELFRTVEPGEATVATPDGGEEVIGRIGVQPPWGTVDVRYQSVPISQAVAEGARSTWRTTGLIAGFLRDLFTGNVPLGSVGSIGAIAEMSGDAASRGPAPFLDFMALFSINLAILNLLPIPILDGGHLVFLLIEAVRGKALSIEQRVRWSQVGLVVLMGIMILALSNDLRRFLGF